MTRTSITRSDHETFCVNEGWTRVRSARGRDVRHHDTYEFPLPDGQVLRTRISRPVNPETYGPALAQHILRDQLRVSVEQFWACVRDRTAPDRGGPRTPPEAIPLEVVNLLINRAGYNEAEVAEMSKDEAIAALNKFWSQPS
jgi:hypothetical protein